MGDIFITGLQERERSEENDKVILKRDVRTPLQEYYIRWINVWPKNS